jgi:haloalkane dehalogenase
MVTASAAGAMTERAPVSGDASSARGDPRDAVDTGPFRALYPWTGSRLALPGGVSMHYLDEGRGEPLLMLHGNPTWSFYFRTLVQGLAGLRRAIVPDHIGCGLSDKPGDDRYRYVLERRVDDVAALLDHLGIGRGLTLVLHDWGGMIGLALAARRPGLVARIIAMNTAGFGLPEGRRLPWQLALARRAPGMSLAVRGLNLFARGAAWVGSKRGRLTREARRGYLAPYDSWAHRIALQRFVEDIPLAPSDPSFAIVDEVSRRLPEIAGVPLLLCWGARDFVFDRHFLAEWRRRLPHAEVHVFEDAGHYVLEDAPEEILAVARAFLERHPLAPEERDAATGGAEGTSRAASAAPATAEARP